MILPGEVVRLKSGGPNMTVEQYVAGVYECVWFDGDVLHRARFEFALLERAQFALK